MVKREETPKIIQETALITPSCEFTKRSAIRVQSVKGKTFIVGIRDFSPEDILWRKENPRVPALICFEEDNSCSCRWNCVHKIVMRCVWLFNAFPELEQVLILFNREEKAIKRKIPTSFKSLGRDLKADDFGESVPRVKVLLIPRDFGEAKEPYRVFPVNYNGLQLVLSTSFVKEIEVPLSFW